MSKYEPLAKFLREKQTDVWEARFEEVERILGFSLPKSAFAYNAWWSNQKGAGHSQTAGWLPVGWQTSDLDLDNRKVRFIRRKSRSSPSREARDGEPNAHLEVMLRKLKQITGQENDDLIIHAAVEHFLHAKAADSLIGLAGTMPGLLVPPRSRPWE